MERIDAVLFDMDGLTLDTESLGFESYLRAGRKFGFNVNERLHMDLAGRTEQGVVDELHRLYGDDKDVATWRKWILNEKEVILQERGGHPGKMPGLLELLNYLDERQIPHALASSTDRPHIEQLLKSEYLMHHFPVIVSGDEVARSKPDPEIFNIAAEKLGVKPAHALVLEDSRAGIKAAVAGGFISGFVFDDVSRKGEVTDGCPILVDLPDPRTVRDIADYSLDSLTDAIALIEGSRTKEDVHGA